MSEVVEALETSRVEELTIRGPLNGKDIAYLISMKEKVGSLFALDLKDVQLVPDGTAYATISYGTNKDGMSTETVYYILSDNIHIESKWSYNGLGGYKSTIYN